MVGLIDLAPWGYAPGMHFFYCSDCNRDEPEQGHRHATRCPKHAMEARLREIRAADTPLPEVAGPEPCNSTFWLKVMFMGGAIVAGILGGTALQFSG